MCAVASAPGAPGAARCLSMAPYVRGIGPRTGRLPPEGVHVASSGPRGARDMLRIDFTLYLRSVSDPLDVENTRGHLPMRR